jgi:hypothetical protein
MIDLRRHRLELSSTMLLSELPSIMHLRNFLCPAGASFDVLNLPAVSTFNRSDN